jgi:hypothetical protein
MCDCAKTEKCHPRPFHYIDFEIMQLWQPARVNSLGQRDDANVAQATTMNPPRKAEASAAMPSSPMPTFTKSNFLKKVRGTSCTAPSSASTPRFPRCLSPLRLIYSKAESAPRERRAARVRPPSVPISHRFRTRQFASRGQSPLRWRETH